jgi:putative membrane protein
MTQLPRGVQAPPGLAWHRMHPVTPLVNSWRLTVAILVAVFMTGEEGLMAALASIGLGPVVQVLAVLVLGFGLGTAIAAVIWSRTTFAVGPDTVYLKKGVIARSQRSARLDRVQAIDVVQPLLARIFGLAELRIDVAGGSGSNVSLAFLKEDDAWQLRADLLAASAGLKAASGLTPSVAHGSSAAMDGPEQPVFDVPVSRLVGSLVLSVGTLAVLACSLVFLVLAIVLQEVAFLSGILPALLTIWGVVWGRFAGGFNFRASLAADGIRLRHGMLEARQQTLPPGRVQALAIQQGLAWRIKGWWRVTINVAGYGVENVEKLSTLLPVGGFDEVARAVWLVLPDLGTADPRGLMEIAMTGTGQTGGFTTVSPRARIVDPCTWRRTGFVQTDRAMIIRSGWVLRKVVIVPHEKPQSLGVTQGPIERALGIVSFRLHSTVGSIAPKIPHLDPLVADWLMTDQSARSRAARSAARPEQWLRPLLAGDAELG